MYGGEKALNKPDRFFNGAAFRVEIDMTKIKPDNMMALMFEITIHRLRIRVSLQYYILSLIGNIEKRSMRYKKLEKNAKFISSHFKAQSEQIWLPFSMNLNDD